MESKLFKVKEPCLFSMTYYVVAPSTKDAITYCGIEDKYADSCSVEYISSVTIAQPVCDRIIKTESTNND